MNYLRIDKSIISGIADFHASKSMLQRGLLLCGLFADDRLSDFIPFLNGKDTNLAFNAAKTIRTDNAVIICEENATLLRMLLPIRAALGLSTKYILSERLFERCEKEIRSFEALQISIAKEQGVISLTVSGSLYGNSFIVDSSRTSQLFSGYLIAVAVMNGGRVIPKGKVTSLGYINMTIEALRKLGFECSENERGYIISGKQHKKPQISDFIENDWTHQANNIVLGILCGELFIPRLTVNSFQGDKKLFDILKSACCNIEAIENGLLARKGAFFGITADASEIPDLIPILCVLAAFAKTDSVIQNVGRLRIKESDRLKACCDLIYAAGGKYELNDDTLIIRPRSNFVSQKQIIDSYGDHRIAMAATVLGAAIGNVYIKNYDCTGKSSFDFYEQFGKEGGIANVVDME